MQDDLVITTALLGQLLVGKAPEKLEAWQKYLSNQEFESVGDLRKLSDDGWKALELPLAVRDALRSSLSAPAASAAAAAPVAAATPEPASEPLPLITQLDCIVMDVSSSMKAKSSIDPLKTREDMSKLLFHTMVDKLVSLECSHAVGLISFGAKVFPVSITREYERFHDHLGRLDAREGATALYDSIYAAAQYLQKYAAENAKEIRQNDHPDCKPGTLGCVLRVFVLTDGEDNASKQPAWQVAQYLQQSGIVLDSIPLAGSSTELQCISTASGGLCLRVTSEEQGLALFERQAVLRLCDRDPPAAVPLVTSAAALAALQDKSAVVEQVKMAVAREVKQTTKALSLSALDAALAAAPAAPAGGGAAGSASAAQASAGALKRILKEYRDIITDPRPGVFAFMSADNNRFWKLVIQGPEDSPYAGGFFMLSVQFPETYPFKPPTVRFVTPVYHCNINGDGNICLDVLKNSWSPALTASKVATTLQLLLEHPNPDDALDAFKAQVYLTEKDRYLKEAKDFTARHASKSLAELKAQYNIVD